MRPPLWSGYRLDLNPMKTALLVIDVQVGIIDHFPSYNKDQVLTNINNLLTRARAARVPVIYLHTTAERGIRRKRIPQAGRSISASRRSKANRLSRRDRAVRFTKLLNWLLGCDRFSFPISLSRSREMETVNQYGYADHISSSAGP